MSTFWICFIAGLGFGGIIVFTWFINRKDQKDNKEFWNKYFKLLEDKSEQTARDIESGKTKVEFINGKMILTENIICSKCNKPIEEDFCYGYDGGDNKSILHELCAADIANETPGMLVFKRIKIRRDKC